MSNIDIQYKYRFSLSIQYSGKIEALTLANVRGVEMLVPRSVESGLATIAIDSFGIVLAILTDTASLVVAVYVEGRVFLVDLGVVSTHVRVAETVAR